MKTLYESILSSTKSGSHVIAEIVYNKLLNGEKLSEAELELTNTKVSVFKVDRVQLTNLLKNLKYNDISLNWLDVSGVTDMTWLFYKSKFDGDISMWDVSKVTNMGWMFYESEFTGKNGGISKWNVSRVINMVEMFSYSGFNENISKWNVSRVKDMSWMFHAAKFNKDISTWKINKKTCETIDMFEGCPIKEEYKPKSLQD